MPKTHTILGQSLAHVCTWPEIVQIFCLWKKEFSGSMSCPTLTSLQRLRKLVGSLKMTSDICLVLEKPQPGQGRWKNSDRFWILESFSDSDWLSNQSRRRSTSSGMHMLNGCFLFGSSRTQRVISLSSCEAELHALVSTLCDDFF